MKTLIRFTIGILITAFALAVSPKISSAQDPVKLSPQYYKILLDNDKVRVLEYRLKPGQKEMMHSHPPGIVYFFGPATFRMKFPGGRTEEDTLTAGQTYWRDSVTHASENIGSTEAHAIAVELKCPCK